MVEPKLPDAVLEHLNRLYRLAADAPGLMRDCQPAEVVAELVSEIRALECDLYDMVQPKPEGGDHA